MNRQSSFKHAREKTFMLRHGQFRPLGSPAAQRRMRMPRSKTPSLNQFLTAVRSRIGKLLASAIGRPVAGSGMGAITREGTQ